MSQSKTATSLTSTKELSNLRCVKCHSYLIPLTEGKTDLFEFTLKQKRKIREYGLTHICPRCMRGYQREEKPLSEESRARKLKPINREKEKPLPFADVIKSFEANVIDNKGRTHRIMVTDKSLLHAEQIQPEKKKKNPDLVCLGRLNRDKIYYNPIYEQMWLLRLKPVWVQNKRVMKDDSWNRLENHDLETLLAFGLVWYRDFKAPLKRRIYIREPVFRRMKRILDRYDQWEGV